jgi:hypothetical protein
MSMWRLRCPERLSYDRPVTRFALAVVTPIVQA